VLWLYAVVLELLTGGERRAVGCGDLPVAAGGEVPRVLGRGDADVSVNNLLWFVLWPE
jgi:hypothetical protein